VGTCGRLRATFTFSNTSHLVQSSHSHLRPSHQTTAPCSMKQALPTGLNSVDSHHRGGTFRPMPPTTLHPAPQPVVTKIRGARSQGLACFRLREDGRVLIIINGDGGHSRGEEELDGEEDEEEISCETPTPTRKSSAIDICVRPSTTTKPNGESYRNTPAVQKGALSIKGLAYRSLLPPFHSRLSDASMKEMTNGPRSLYGRHDTRIMHLPLNEALPISNRQWCQGGNIID
ncbi:hypothetical protein BKA70DRAFT_608469, partial [Coprinopsis sp. MPI-PUGE-AT-0042]